MFLNRHIYVANINKKEVMILKDGKKENIDYQTIKEIKILL